MGAKEVPVPDELAVLLPEQNKRIIVIGEKAYELYPLWEGQLELVSKDIALYFDDIFNPDRKCPKCGKVVKNAVGKKIEECPVDKETLSDVRKSPVESIIGGGKVPEWIHMILDLPVEEVKSKLTLLQLKHVAAVFYLQNFSSEGLPKESQENFQKLLGMIGMGKAPSAGTEEKTEKTEPTPA